MKSQYEVHPLIQITGKQKLHAGRNRKCGLTESVATPDLKISALHGYTEQDDFVASWIAIKNNIPIYTREKKQKYINGLYETRYIPKTILKERQTELNIMFNNMNLIPVTLFQYDPIVLGKNGDEILPKSKRYGDNSYINPKDIDNEFKNLFQQKAKRECSTHHKLVTLENIGKKKIFGYQTKNYTSLTTTCETITDNSLKNSFIKETFNACSSKQIVDKSSTYDFVVDGLNMLHGCYHPTSAYRANIHQIAKDYRKDHPECGNEWLKCLLVMRAPICDSNGFYPGGQTRNELLKPFLSCRKLKQAKNKWSAQELSFNVGKKARVYVDVLYVWQTIEIPTGWANEWRRTNNSYTIENQSLELIEEDTKTCRWNDDIEQINCYTGVKGGYNIISEQDGGGWETVQKKKKNKRNRRKF